MILKTLRLALVKSKKFDVAGTVSVKRSEELLHVQLILPDSVMESFDLVALEPEVELLTFLVVQIWNRLILQCLNVPLFFLCLFH